MMTCGRRALLLAAWSLLTRVAAESMKPAHPEHGSLLRREAQSNPSLQSPVMTEEALAVMSQNDQLKLLLHQRRLKNALKSESSSNMNQQILDALHGRNSHNLHHRATKHGKGGDSKALLEEENAEEESGSEDFGGMDDSEGDGNDSEDSKASLEEKGESDEGEKDTKNKASRKEVNKHSDDENDRSDDSRARRPREEDSNDAEDFKGGSGDEGGREKGGRGGLRERAERSGSNDEDDIKDAKRSREDDDAPDQGGSLAESGSHQGWSDERRLAEAGEEPEESEESPASVQNAGKIPEGEEQSGSLLEMKDSDIESGHQGQDSDEEPAKDGESLNERNGSANGSGHRGGSLSDEATDDERDGDEESEPSLLEMNATVELASEKELDIATREAERLADEFGDGPGSLPFESDQAFNEVDDEEEVKKSTHCKNWCAGDTSPWHTKCRHAECNSCTKCREHK